MVDRIRGRGRDRASAGRNADAEGRASSAATLASDHPVTARGVLLARQLLRDPGSPLFSDESEHLLPRALTRVLGALEA